MSETSGSPFRIVQYLYRLPVDLAVGGDYHLADTLPVVHGERCGREIDQDNADLATVVRIDRSRRIQQSDTVFQCQAAAGAHLCFVTFGQGNI